MSNRIRLVVMFAAALLALAWLYGRFRPSANVSGIAEPIAPVTAQSIAQAPVAEARATSSGERSENARHDEVLPPGRFRVSVSPGGTPILRARQGEALTIDITSDRRGTLEIHGYGKEVAVVPGSEVTINFVATRTGRFPIDLHGRDGRHLEVTALEVQPR
jgi:hypothetical protein